ncbi:hypothetical protein D3C71_1732100 [compost metagenome]
MHRQHVLRYPVIAHGGQALAGGRVVQAHLGDAVAAPLCANAQYTVQAGDPVGQAVRGLGAEHAAPVGLLELVTVDRVAQEVGEVGEQVEAVVDGIGADLGLALGPLVEPFA